MDLTKMDRSDLARLRGVISTLSTAADLLAEAGLDPEISLTPDATTLRAMPVVDFGTPAPAPVLIERVDDLDRAVEIVGPLPVLDQQVMVIRGGGASCGKSDHGGGSPAAPVLTGPLSDDERAEVIRLSAAGKSNIQIAEAMNRRVQTIGLFLAAQGQNGIAKPRAKADTAAGFRPEGEIAAQMVAEVADTMPAGQPVPPAEDAPEPVTDAGMSKGPDVEAGAHQPPSAPTAEDAAATEVAVAGAAPDETPRGNAPATERADTTVPAGVRGEQLRIWQHLDRVGYRGMFDADLDLEMCDLLLSGHKSPAVAATLGIDTDAIACRFALLAQPIRDERGRCSLDGQSHLLAVLKARAIRARRAAA